MTTELSDSICSLVLVTRSGRFDETFYRERARVPDGQNPIEHYLAGGWRTAEPASDFDGAFLAPFYQASGFEGAPLLIWLELQAIRLSAPRSRDVAEAMAAELKTFQVFDPGWYSMTLPPGMDPYLHFAVIGETLGWRPSPAFDPAYYIDRHPDLAAQDIRAVVHFETHGRSEGRRAISIAEEVIARPSSLDQRPTIVVVTHDASRTGAPILALELATRFSSNYNVVPIVLRNGELFEEFAAAGPGIVGPFQYQDYAPIEMSRIAGKVVDLYDPLFVIANSIESSFIVPHLAMRGVPVITLMHEFAAYTRPISKLRDVSDWSARIVFPAEIVAESAYHQLPELRGRHNIHVFPQGRVTPPPVNKQAVQLSDTAPDEEYDSVFQGFVVLGAGHVQIRKGVDLFLSTAAAVRKLAPDCNIRFVWIGDGYDPEGDVTYSAYLSEQRDRAGLGEMVQFLRPTSDIESVYKRSSVFFMCSRLDPQPNVGIDALSMGIPTVAFAGASGTAEVLARDPATRDLVVPHLDTHAAAEVICRLFSNPSQRQDLSNAVAILAARMFDMNKYVSRLETFGREVSTRTRSGDRDIIASCDDLDLDFLFPPGFLPPAGYGPANVIIQQWIIAGTSSDPTNIYFRRPYPGFHPQIYAMHHLDHCVDGTRNPFAHWVEAGKPSGPWLRQVFSPNINVKETPLRLAMHMHLHYPDLADDLAWRLKLNSSVVDLYVTTNTDEKARQIKLAFLEHRGSVEICISPNEGRDVAPFLSWLSRLVPKSYDVIGHVHGKKSLSTDIQLGNRWRDFLFENLVGGAFPMLDQMAAVFADHASIGLVMAEDPHIIGWNANRNIAEHLANQMDLKIGVEGLPLHFDFPLGTMFWARPEALLPLAKLDLKYPPEPLPYDGTILHAIERLIPFVAASSGYRTGSLRVPGTTW